MKRKQQLFRLGLIALLGGVGQAALAQQQPNSQRTAPAAQQNNRVQQATPIVQQTAAPAAQQQAAPQPGGQAPAPAPARGDHAPFPAISPEYQKFLDQVLTLWSTETQHIERYRCDFQRWTYEGEREHAKFAKGNIRFMQPDKGLFKVEEMFFLKGHGADGAPNYGKVDGQFGEWWVCDGKILHEFDRSQKKVTRYHLPEEMQGVAIINSPLPFLFGVKVEKIKAKYWLQPVEGPPDQNGKPRTDIIVIEAWPRKQIDAQNFKKVKIYLDQKEFLPLALEIFLPNWVPGDDKNPGNDQREVFQFANREKNWNLLDRALNFNKEFIDTSAPKDWTIEDAPAVEEEPAGNTAQQPAPAQSKR